jgi:hypothetical protein
VTPESHVRHGGAPDEPPPLGSWWRLYALVLAALAVDVAFLWWLTERFR